MFMDVFKSVFKATITSAMIFVSIVRLGAIAYPVAPQVEYSVAPAVSAEQENIPVIQSQVTSPETKRRIVLGQSSIENLGQSN